MRNPMTLRKSGGRDKAGIYHPHCTNPDPQTSKSPSGQSTQGLSFVYFVRQGKMGSSR